MKKYLIVFDLDSTILPSINVMAPGTVEAVRRAREAGHIVVASSARPWEMCRWVYEALGLDTAISTINGSYIFNPTDPSFPEKEVLMDRETIGALLRACGGDCFPGYIELRGKLFHTEGPHNGYYLERMKVASSTVVFDIDSLPDTPGSRFIFTPKDAEAEERVLATAGSLGNVVANMWAMPYDNDPNKFFHRISIGPVGANKWESLKYIADYYGISTEDCYAFGDNWNDYEMIRNAGHGFALWGSDAARQPDIKNVTRLTCARGGVAEVIEREILKLHD